MCY
jgi:magnesium-transporting ATPase (P-type)